MDTEAITQWLADGGIEAIENAWMEAVERREPLASMKQTLQLVIDAGQPAPAEAMGWMLLSHLAESSPADEALEALRTILPMLKADRELRETAADIYRQVHGEVEHFEKLLAASGLRDNQPTHRAVRTLDTCLAIRSGNYLANRYDHRVVRVEGFDTVLGEFQLTEAGGQTAWLEPKLMADEYELTNKTDFRVLRDFGGECLAEVLAGDPKELLVSVCKGHGGQIASTDLKDLLVPRHIPAEKWSGWWNRARTAVRRSDQLVLSGRNPAVITFHPHGRSLEDELSEQLNQAKMPQDYFAVLQRYTNEIRHRRQEIDTAFVQSIMDELARQVMRFRDRLGNNALAAALMIATAQKTGMPAPQTECPTVGEIIDGLSNPAQMIADLEEASLWGAAYEAIAARPDADEQFEKLFRVMPSGQLDTIAQRLRSIGRTEAIENTVADALARPAEYVQVCLWLWAGPSEKIPNTPGALELLGRLLTAMDELHRDWDVAQQHRRESCQQVRTALIANGCKMFRAAVEQMDDELAGGFKRRVERSDGLSHSSRDKLLMILREEFYLLFVEARVEPWLDKSVIWATNESAHRQEAEIKELHDVKLLANSRAIGVAAEKGDLRENSEWQFAIEEQRRLHGLLAKMQDDLIRIRILDPNDVPTDTVGVGSRVTLCSNSDGTKVDVTFLGPWESDINKKIFNYQTPLAQLFMGKAVGAAVTTRFDGGSEVEYTIERITSWR